MIKNADSINVIYKFIDGAHFFVSDDKKAAGLCVAHKDIETAYKEVGHQLSALLYFNHGVKTDYKPSIPIEKFKDIINAFKSITKLADEDGLVTPATIQPWLHNMAHKNHKETA